MVTLRGRFVRFASAVVGLIAFAYLGAMLTWERPSLTMPQILGGNGSIRMYHAAHLASRFHHGGRKNSPVKKNGAKNVKKGDVVKGKVFANAKYSELDNKIDIKETKRKAAKNSEKSLKVLQTEEIWRNNVDKQKGM
ncbi:hypothetical protein PoB_001970400 [Plakobranchus ocellatus]|uniref:Uncharacterized protein n=1 Tax=Plakobranchus ocellatus TaxID=259542 RepID=A0AAV3ZFR0_9GAST|nr:hypothetical protein PoB_001970400 [Plakobranchus ocellatus]